ncbi:MAG: rhodanese-like domain-containing protein [Candidatus Latescibacteria bacterium]|jgi:rhodanese-related sulfurtransferase|nr:rhodanese-like domain-containing protein [Candidatus Latescibacterota bacterium]
MTVCEDMFSRVQERLPASSQEAHDYFCRKLRCETDAFDVTDDRERGMDDFELVDVRSEEAYLEGHAAGAIHIHYSDMTEERMLGFPKDRLLVVYCWGPGCNGATKAAMKLSALGFQVKEMIGGIEWWEEEGYEIERLQIAN